MRITIILLALALTGCPSPKATNHPKSIYSYWYGFDKSYDLSDGKAGSFEIKVYRSGEECECDGQLTGDELEGTLQVSGCSNAPLCTPLEKDYTYSRDDEADDLNLCDEADDCFTLL